MKRTALIIRLLMVGLTASAVAQQPNIQNAKLETRSAGGGLQAQIDAVARGGAAAWVAWSVPSIKPEADMCCYNMHNDNVTSCGCALENGNVAHISSNGSAGPIKLEGSKTFN